MSLKTNVVTASLRLNRKFVTGIIVIFYLVGICGTALPLTHDFFLMLFPWAILLSFLTILLFHDSSFDIKTLVVLVITAVCGYFIEVAGVRTHQIFGNYLYGPTLGLKLFNTPLIIGINWVMLVYATGSLVQPWSLSDPVKILIASLLMVGYDIVMEYAAPVLGMWNWDKGVVPLQNYIAWFAIALVFHFIYKLLGIRTGSTLALPVLICQVVFFLFLILYFNLAG
jgi:bisanhydrobacterioruberin hydratase